LTIEARGGDVDNAADKSNNREDIEVEDEDEDDDKAVFP
jgi:hypothetical protein